MRRFAYALCALTAACQAPILEIDLPLAAVSWSPQDGATDVCPSWPITVCFNQPLDPASLGSFLVGTSQTCAPGAAIASPADVAASLADTSTPSANPGCVVLPAPSGGWTPDGCYTIEAEGEDLRGGAAVAALLPDGGSDLLAVTLRSVFRVASGSAACLQPPDAG